jgi:hypothetical protein
MRVRCIKKKDKAYPRYGGRGIKVCERWLNDFSAFFDDMGERPTKNHSLDRIDNDGDYSPANCRWATSKEQNTNKRNIVFIEVNGRRVCLKDAARAVGLNYATVKYRRLSGWKESEWLQPIGGT